MSKEKLTIPIWEKMNLTIEEAAAYSNIGINKLDDIAKCNLTEYMTKRTF